MDGEGRASLVEWVRSCAVDALGLSASATAEVHGPCDEGRSGGRALCASVRQPVAGPARPPAAAGGSGVSPPAIVHPVVVLRGREAGGAEAWWYARSLAADGAEGVSDAQRGQAATGEVDPPGGFGLGDAVGLAASQLAPRAYGVRTVASEGEGGGAGEEVEVVVEDLGRGVRGGGRRSEGMGMEEALTAVLYVAHFHHTFSRSGPRAAWAEAWHEEQEARAGGVFRGANRDKGSALDGRDAGAEWTRIRGALAGVEAVEGRAGLGEKLEACRGELEARCSAWEDGVLREDAVLVHGGCTLRNLWFFADEGSVTGLGCRAAGLGGLGLGRPAQDLAALLAGSVEWNTQRIAPNLVGAYVEERERLRVLHTPGAERRRVELLVYEMDALVKQLRVCLAEYALKALETGLWAPVTDKDAMRALASDPAKVHDDLCTRQPRSLVWTVLEAEGALPLLNVPEGADEDDDPGVFKGFDSSAPPSEMSVTDESDYGEGLDTVTLSAYG